MIVIGTVCAVAVLAAVVLFAVSPREIATSPVTIDPGTDPEAVVGAEESIPQIRENGRKLVVWNDPQTKRRTPLAIVYVHGFSASREEIRPVPDLIAQGLGANLFFTRLTGHGRDGPAMADATLEKWMADLGEALSVGLSLGEKLIVISTSTGGPLVTKALEDPKIEDAVAAAIFVSPNFRVNDPFGWLLNGRLASSYVPLLLGSTRSFEPENEGHGENWTNSYPSQAVLPMADAVAAAAGVDVSAIGTPALFVFSDADEVVDPAVTRTVAGNWGGPSEIHTVTDSPDDGQHVIAGDILSPQTTKPVAEKALKWLQTVLPN